jgi:hypothetical protein
MKQASPDDAEVRQLRKAVQHLQQESSEQLHLEYESQATFEFLKNQVASM